MNEKRIDDALKYSVASHWIEKDLEEMDKEELEKIKKDLLNGDVNRELEKESVNNGKIRK